MADVADAKIDAWLSSGDGLQDQTAASYYVHMEDEVAEEQLSEYEIALRKRAEHVPLQHITGEAGVYGTELSGQFQMC